MEKRELGDYNKGLLAVFLHLWAWSSHSLAIGWLYGTVWRSCKGIRTRPAVKVYKNNKVATSLERGWTKSRVLSCPFHPYAILSSSGHILKKWEVLPLDTKITNLYLLSCDPSLKSTLGKCLQIKRILRKYHIRHTCKKHKVMCSLTARSSDQNWRSSVMSSFFFF